MAPEGGVPRIGEAERVGGALAVEPVRPGRHCRPVGRAPRPRAARPDPARQRRARGAGDALVRLPCAGRRMGGRGASDGRRGRAAELARRHPGRVVRGQRPRRLRPRLTGRNTESLRLTVEVSAVGDDSFERTSRWWWEGLERSDGVKLPQSVRERLTWYERHTPRARVAFYSLESAVIL